SLTADSVNNSAAAIIGFSAPSQTATMPDPIIQTPGRVFYVMAAGNSEGFTLSLNAGANLIAMQPNTAKTLIWSGSDWLMASSDSTNLQAAQNMTYDSNSGELLIDESGDSATPAVDNLDTSEPDTSEKPASTEPLK